MLLTEGLAGPLPPFRKTYYPGQLSICAASSSTA